VNCRLCVYTACTGTIAGIKRFPDEGAQQFPGKGNHIFVPLPVIVSRNIQHVASLSITEKYTTDYPYTIKKHAGAASFGNGSFLVFENRQL
jgi:hypothetical protein